MHIGTCETDSNTIIGCAFSLNILKKSWYISFGKSHQFWNFTHCSFGISSLASFSGPVLGNHQFFGGPTPTVDPPRLYFGWAGSSSWKRNQTWHCKVGSGSCRKKYSLFPVDVWLTLLCMCNWWHRSSPLCQNSGILMDFSQGYTFFSQKWKFVQMECRFYNATVR